MYVFFWGECMPFPVLLFVFFLGFGVQAMELPSHLSFSFDALTERRMIRGLDGVLGAGLEMDDHRNGAFRICNDLRDDACALKAGWVMLYYIEIILRKHGGILE